jgi:L-cystine uptake protein TcyP (sodium:dicarboxylate symporter family)
MSKKKSYMDFKNILSEDIISSFFKGLFTGVTGKKVKSTKQATKDIEQSVDKFNSAIDKMYSAINKVRKADGKPPRKPPKKMTVKDVLDDYAKGKL